MFHDNEDVPCTQVIPVRNGFILPVTNHFLTLDLAAEAYFYLGYSVIPLLGDVDPSRPKMPAIPWASFQQRRATLQEQQEWFREGGFAGLGIVTGRISNIVVLDFDSESIFNAFKVQFPALTETHVIRSAGRQLPHLYFKLPSHLHLPSQKGQGVDLLSNGRFVVAPPTNINGQAYKIIRGGMPKTLTEHDIPRIQSFLDSNKMISRPEKGEKRNSLIIRGEKLTPNDLHTLYSSLIQKEGRNEALFRTSLRARDYGWTQLQTESCLVALHTHQPSLESSSRERPAQRQKEALSTIRSAFSKPARLFNTQAPRNTLQLSNSVSETLMQRKITCVVRTYEGLLHAGMCPGQVITAKEAVEHLKGLVGRDSVLKALKAGQGDKRFFAPPICPPKTANAVATNNSLKPFRKNASEGSKNQEKIRMGRPQHLFRIPTNDELCAILGVKVTGSDPLAQSDLASAHQTRMALHRELIKRRPGQYPCGWLARRMGVSKRTIATYNRLLPIHNRPMFIETLINWKTIERLPFDEPTSGAVLVTQAGKRYPALRTIASRLLAKGEVLSLKEQTVSFYWHGDIEPILARLQVQQEMIVRQEHIETYMGQNTREMPVKQGEPVTIALALSPLPVVEKGRAIKKPVTLHNYRKPLKNADQEALAKQVYETLEKEISLANARRLAMTYGETKLVAALKLIHQRALIRNWTGFLITILRSEQIRPFSNHSNTLSVP